ncbi:MAG: hypothetical protein A2675_04195 [Candidatus Yonathbacteria bacterium RIFCSPHIGHO2_01_FULL_51_10]|uniref:Uncharacterized protein n=1 Tax=Candidatus Yonathbacteria bacterium RIFCSPHIGHO2_01_FULL_51_10 TaxID=1802723 RepID=A0A1G2S4X4_9BACT|nr:MAG: hypothetical protein A2675_04195 [Candidatus Yonathbacteria bacterium RIFCSPHIGHO2_01_FULL_51_10]
MLVKTVDGLVSAIALRHFSKGIAARITVTRGGTPSLRAVTYQNGVLIGDTSADDLDILNNKIEAQIQKHLAENG